MLADNTFKWRAPFIQLPGYAWTKRPSLYIDHPASPSFQSLRLQRLAIVAVGQVRGECAHKPHTPRC